MTDSAAPAPGTPAPAASVVIVNWRQPELTARAVESVLAQVVDAAIELVIVENEATPGSADALRSRFPSAVVVENAANEGFAGGVTSGIAVASGAVIVLLNNDAVAEPGFLAAGLARLDASPARVAAVAAHIVLEGRYRPAPAGDGSRGLLVGVDGARWQRAPDAAAGSGVELTNSTGVVLTRSGNCYDRDWLAPVGAPGNGADSDSDSGSGSSGRTGEEPFAFTGGAVFLRTAALEAVGGFDTRFFMYYEDVDLSWRLRLAGYDIVYEPGARVVHRHAGSSDHDSPLVRAYSMRNRTLTLLKNAPLRPAVAVVARSLLRALADAVGAVRRPGAAGGGPSGAFLDRAGWRLYLTTLARLAPALLRARRATPAATRRATYRRFAR
ncbi:MAG: glycosyltransferase [Herbiconiux sp.]|nr:glycosyltransferase [Herbiconiux sp.]